MKFNTVTARDLDSLKITRGGRSTGDCFASAYGYRNLVTEHLFQIYRYIYLRRVVSAKSLTHNEPHSGITRLCTRSTKFLVNSTVDSDQ